MRRAFISLFVFVFLFFALASVGCIQFPQITPSPEEINARNSLSLAGYPDVVPADGFAYGSLIATLKIHGDLAPNEPVTFRTTHGTISPQTTYTSWDGRATARITATTPGKAIVYAVYENGGLDSNAINITFVPAPVCGDGACGVGESADSCPEDCAK
ncbi:MAG: Ig-like domain-containing protein [Candidatus Micrarchaeota archaeon]